MTPLEALDKIKNSDEIIQDDYYGIRVGDCFEEELDIIETALKDYEKKTKLAKEYADVNNVAKRLKAFEIIKEKRVDVSWLMTCFGFIENSTNEEERDYYNNNYEAYRNSKPLTQDEFDLLKEVLL